MRHETADFTAVPGAGRQARTSSSRSMLPTGASTGASYAIFANQLEMFGGNVLGGLFLGRTHYKYAK